MNKDELKGKNREAIGHIKQGVGNLTGDERLRDEGVADEVSGELRQGFGKTRRKVGEAIEDLGDRMKR